MIKYFEQKSYEFKLACDGHDLLNKINGNLLGRYGKKYVQKHCVISSFDTVESFISNCIKERRDKNILPRKLTEYLCDKYEVGFFKTHLNNCIDNNYILFNKEQLSFWEQVDVNLWDLEFMVVPSRNYDGTINEIGFRILNSERIHNAFKWLFPYGQQATFGLNLCNKNEELLLCEGFQDMVAFRESGYKNAVGLGSLEITEKHKLQLQTDNYVFCPDLDPAGINERKNCNFRTCSFEPEEKDPYESYLKYGYVKVK